MANWLDKYSKKEEAATGTNWLEKYADLRSDTEGTAESDMSDTETITPSRKEGGGWKGVIPALLPPRNRIERMKGGSVDERVAGNAANYDPNLPDWTMGKAFKGGISDSLGRTGAIINMNTNEIESSAANKDMTEVAASPYLTQTEKAAILRSKSIGSPELYNELMAQREWAKEAALSGQEYFDPGAYNMPTSVAGQLVHDVTRAMPYTLGSMAYNIPVGIASGGGSFMASLLAASPEAQMEQADVYDELRKRGMSHEEAYEASQKVLAANMAMLPMSNYLQSMAVTGMTKAVRAADAGAPLDTLLGRTVGRAMKNERLGGILRSDNVRAAAGTLVDILGEGGEEVAQGYASDKALGNEIDKRALAYEGVVGGMMGALFGVGGNIADRAFNGRVNVKGKPRSEVDSFMDGIAGDIENASAAAPQSGVEGTIMGEGDTEGVSRKFVPNTRILNEMRNFYREIRSIPEAQRSAEDNESFSTLRHILEMYSSGHEREAEALARERFDTGPLEEAPQTAPINMRERAASELAVPVERQTPANESMALLNAIRGKFVEDFRRYGAVDMDSLSGDERYHAALVRAAGDAYQQGDFQRMVNILAHLYAPAETTSETGPIAARERATSELAVPGWRMPEAVRPEAAVQAEAGPRYVEVPYPSRRRKEVAADMSKMSKGEVGRKYGKDIAELAAKRGALAAADAVAKQDQIAKADADKARTQEVAEPVSVPDVPQNAEPPQAEKARELENSPEAPDAAAKKDFLKEHVVVSGVPKNEGAQPANVGQAVDGGERFPVGYEWEEDGVLSRVVDIRKSKGPTVTMESAMLTPTRNGIVATPVESREYPIAGEKRYIVHRDGPDGTEIYSIPEREMPGAAHERAAGAKAGETKGRQPLDNGKIIGQDKAKEKQAQESVGKDKPVKEGSSDDDRGNDAADDKSLEDVLPGGVRGAGRRVGDEAGDGLRKADSLGDGRAEDGVTGHDGRGSVERVAESVLPDAAAGTGGGRTGGGDGGGKGPSESGLHGVQAREETGGSEGVESAKEEKTQQAPQSLLNPRESKPAKLSGENPGNFFIGEDFGLGGGTAGEKIAGNLTALRTLMKLRKEQRYPTREEQAALARYVGWGGLKSVFDVKKAGAGDMYGKAQRVLKELLSPDEYAAAFRTVSDAHYTSKPVVDAMWRVVRFFGFKGGRALEPTVGVGNFLGLEPLDIASATEWHASEIDTVTGDIAALLYPEANILSSTGFQDAPFADNVFDLVIGNPPFGETTIKDRHKSRAHLSGMKIHNYIIAKAGMHLRPGGVMSVVVTHRFLDTANPEARRVLAKDFRFLGAFRLPNDAFAKNAGTDVVTDVIFMQKLRADEKPELNAAWLDTNGRITVDGKDIPVNRYYQEYPSHILGRSAMDGTMYASSRGNEYTVHSDGRDISKAIDDLLRGDFAKLAGVMEETASDADTKAAMIVQSDIPIGSMALDDNGRIVRRAMDDAGGNSVMEEITPNTLWKDNAAEWSAVIDALKDVKKAAAGGKGLEGARDMLDSVSYVARTATGAKRGSPTAAERALYSVQDALESEGPSFSWRFDQELKEIDASYRRKQLGQENYLRLRGMLELRRKLQELNRAERANDPRMEAIRKGLNGLYDSFVFKYGPISDKRNFSLLGVDVGVESGLEADYLPGITPAQAKSKGIKARKASATKADIFTKRVFYPAEEIKRAGSAYDAMEISLSQRGTVDIAYMSDLTGKPVTDVIEELSKGEHPQLFMNPETDVYEHAGEYLSGNVRRKLEVARNAGLEPNIKALEAVQPQPKDKKHVTPNIRATWIPASVYESFLSALGCERPKVGIIPGIGRIRVDDARFNATDFGMQFTNEYKSVPDIFNAAAAGKSLTVRDSKKQVIEEATQKVNALVDRMGKVFSEWVYTDEERTKQIVDAYNEKMNTNVDRGFDGVKYLKTVGSSPSIVLRNTQKNAAWRMIQSKSVLLDHVVGAGKTFTVITGVMERRRLGLSKKPLIVVPNHLVTQWAQDFYRLYPGAKVLAATPADFTAKNRKRLFSRIATTKDVDAIVIGHSSLGYIPSPGADLKAIIREQLGILQQALDEARINGESKRSLSQIAQRIDSYKGQLEEISNRPSDKIGHDLETLGIDYIAVDEAHEFKNLEYATAGDRIVGMNDPSGSKKAFDLYVKLRGLQQRGGGVTFATGTPLSNSLVELYTMMKYLAADDLKERNMLFFDAWAGSYAVTETRLEYTPTQKLTLRRVLAGLNNLSSLRQMYTSFADIITMQDLKDMYRREMEERNRKNKTKLRTEFPVPKVTDGGRKLDTAPATETQRLLTDWLVARMDAVQKNSGDKEYRSIDNYLTVMTDARKMSLDPRIIDPSLPRDENGKVMRCARKVKATYDRWADKKGTQLIFCDMSTPAKAGQRSAKKLVDDAAKMVFSDAELRAFKQRAKGLSFTRQWDIVTSERERLLGAESLSPAQRDRMEEYFSKLEDVDAALSVADSGFSVYDDLKTVLTDMGIPEREIAFIHDYESPEKKQALFDSVNNGDVRVLLGSSAKMGAGMNVQKRLVGLHHLDSPWRSSDVEQREGRIIRQGNMFYEADPEGFSVDITSYSTSGTADTVMWQILARKAAAIEQFRNGGEIDAMAESSSDADQYADFMASSTGDPVFKKKMEAERRFQELDAEVSGALMAQQNARDFLKSYEARSRENQNGLRILKDVTFDGKELSAFSEALRQTEKQYGEDYANFERDNAAYKRELSVWENEPDKKRRGKKPEAPVRPKRPGILSPDVQRASAFARAVKRAIEPLTESSATGTVSIPFAGGKVVVSRINEQYTTPSWLVKFIPGGTDTYDVVIGQAEGKVPKNLSQLTEVLLSPTHIQSKIVSATRNLEQIIRRMESQKKSSEALADRDIPHQARDDAKEAMDWYALQVALAEVRADVERAKRKNPFIENDRKHRLKTAAVSRMAEGVIKVDGVEYRTTGISAATPNGSGTVLEAVRVDNGEPATIISSSGQSGSAFTVMRMPESVAKEAGGKKDTHYRLGPTAQARLDADAAAFAKQVDDFVAGKMGRYAEFQVMQTPLVLQISDARVKPLQIVMSQNTLKKIFTKHKLSPNLVKQIPAALADPIMVFESEGRAKQLQNGLVVMLELKDSQGATINVPIALNAAHKGAQGQIVCNDIASAYGRLSPLTGKPFNDWFVKQAAAPGRLKYVNTKKYSQWISQAGLVGSGGQSIKSLFNSVKTEADLVKAQSAAPGSYALGEKRAGLPPLSVSEVAARVKGAKVTELGEGKMRLDFENGVSWIVDTQAEAIAADPEVVKRDYGREVRPGEVVSGRTRVIDGQRFIDLVAGMSDARTFGHEVFESAWDSLLKEEQAAVLKTHGSRERAAEMYGEFLEGRVGKLTKRTQAIFQRLKDFFSAIRATLFGRNSEDVFREIASGKALNRKAGTVENQEHYRLSVRKPAEASPVSEAVTVEPDASVVVEKDAQWLRDMGTAELERVVRPSRQDESIKDKLIHVKNNYYRQWHDRLNPIKKNFGDDIYFDAENAIYGAASRAERRFEKGDPDSGVKGLVEIMKPIAASEQQGFAAYTVYKHLNDIAANSEKLLKAASALDEAAKAKQREIVEDRRLPSPDKEALSEWKKRMTALRAEHDLYREQAQALREAVKFTKGSAAQYAAAVRKIEEHYPHWKKSQRELVKYNRALLEMIRDSGMISDEMYSRLIDLYPNYVPLQRDFGADEKSVGGFVGGMGLVNIQSPLRRLKGSSRDVIDPLEQIVRNTFQFESAAARQSVGRQIMEEYDKGNFHELMEEVENRHHEPDEMVWHVWDNGVKRLFRSERDIYEALMPRARAKWEDNPVVAASRFITSLLRKGTTHGLTFALRNPVRDTFNYAIVGENFRPVVDTVRGLMMCFDKRVGSIYDEFMQHGGAQGMTVLTRNEHAERMKQLRHESGTVLLSWASLKNPPKAVYELIGQLSEYGELASRLGQYERAKAAGFSAEEAANITRDNMNFMRMGTLGEQVNQHVGFFNAALQGVDKMFRTYFKGGRINKKALLRSFMYITIPSMLQMLYNFGDDDRRKRYENLPAWRKNTFWNFVIGKDGPIVTIPKPFEIGMIFGSLPERALEYVYTKNKRAFDGVGSSMLSSLTPEFYPNAMLLLAEIGSNHSFFYQRQIVSEREKRFEPALQYGPYTAEWAKAAGKALNVSPRLLEYSVFSIGGGLAKETSNVSDALIRKFLTKETRPDRPWYEAAPGTRGFFASDGDATESAFQSEIQLLNRKRATAEEILKTKGPQALSETQKRLIRANNDIKALSKLNNGKGGIYDAYRAVREITTAKNLSAVEKRIRIRRIEENIRNASERGLARIDKINAYLDR